MFDETIMIIPPARQEEVKAVVEQPAPHLHNQEQTLPPPTQEQVRAVEAVFRDHDDQETRAVAALMGVWTGTLLLRDVAIETFDESADEKELRLKEKKKAK
jgi:hypothetical protein